MQKKYGILSFLLALGLLGAVGCSGKLLTVTKDDLGDAGIAPSGPYEPYDYEDECEVVHHGRLVIVGFDVEFPVYVCQFDDDVPPNSDDPVTPPMGDDAGVPPSGGDAGMPPSGDDAGVPPNEPVLDAGTPNEPMTDAGMPNEPQSDAGTPNEPEVDSGTPGEPSSDAGTSNEPENDAGTPNEPETDAGTPPNGDDAGCDEPEEEPKMCNCKITVVVHSGKTTTYRDDVLHCTFSVENTAVNTRVVRSCDKETEMAETKVIGVVGKSGQLKVILTTPHRCGHYHNL